MIDDYVRIKSSWSLRLVASRDCIASYLLNGLLKSYLRNGRFPVALRYQIVVAGVVSVDYGQRQSHAISLRHVKRLFFCVPFTNFHSEALESKGTHLNIGDKSIVLVIRLVGLIVNIKPSPETLSVKDAQLHCRAQMTPMVSHVQDRTTATRPV